MIMFICVSVINIGRANDPNSFNETVYYPKINNWLTAMQGGLKSMQYNDIWDLVDLPNILKLVGC